MSIPRELHLLDYQLGVQRAGGFQGHEHRHHVTRADPEASKCLHEIRDRAAWLRDERRATLLPYVNV